jgi:MarR family transcriptional regulator, organic hydroperoxide resistance regulator
MSVTPFEAHLQRERTHAAVSFELDEALGTHHGISWADFVLLQSLDDARAAAPYLGLSKRLGLLRSQLLRRVLPLEKTGLVAHTTSAAGHRAVVLSEAGRRVLREARETAAAVCASAHDGSSG